MFVVDSRVAIAVARWRTSFQRGILMRSNMLKVAWSAIFFCQERLAIVELARSAAGAFGRIRAVQVWCVTVSNVTEPKQGAPRLVLTG